MLGQQSKGSIKLQCTEQAFSEFPNLLIGTQAESGIAYFDATLYLQKTQSEKSVNDFFSQYRTPILSLCDSYEIKYENVCQINESGHYLIDGNFIYLFISFVEPNFLAYICDRMNDLFANGVAVSDTYLLQMTRVRLSKEVLETITDDERNGH